MAQTELDLLLRVIRGELPLRSLGAIGVTVCIEGSRCRVDNPRGLQPQARVPDLAQGVLAHRHDPVALREWALFIQAADIEVDAPRHPAERAVLAALWDAACLNPLGAETVAALERAARETLAG